jgi:hypothetical protein
LSFVAYVLIFAAGLMGSLHCVAMCGGFPLALAAGGAGQRNLSRQLLYNFGRLNTLVAIGAVSGALGTVVVGGGPVWMAERLLALVAGLFMIVVGLEMLGVVAGVTAGAAVRVQRTLGDLLGGVMRSR